MKKPKYNYKMARMGLPIIHMPKRKPQRQICWCRVIPLASCVALWVAVIWLLVKGGAA